METSGQPKLHYGYFIVAACCACMLCVSIAVSCIGLFYTPMAQAMGTDVSAISYYITAMFIVAFVVMLFGGSIFEKLDIRMIATAGVISLGLDVLVCSFATAPWMVWLGGGIGGVGNALCMNLISPIMINRWFAKRSGFFIAFAAIFTGVGSVVFSPIIGAGINSLGWEMTLRICGIAIFAIGLPFSLFVFRNYPADKGLLAFGAEATDDPNAGTSNEELPGIEASQAYRMPAFYVIALFAAAMSLMLYTQAMNPNYIKSLPISENLPMLFSIVASCLMASQIVAKLVLGVTGDKVPIASGVCALAIGIVGFVGNLFFADSQAGLIFSACCIGVVTSLVTVLLPILTRSVFGLKDYSKIYPKLTAVISLVGMLQAPVLGSVLAANGWGALETAFIALCCVAIVALLLCKMFTKRSER